MRGQSRYYIVISCVKKYARPYDRTLTPERDRTGAADTRPITMPGRDSEIHAAQRSSTYHVAPARPPASGSPTVQPARRLRAPLPREQSTRAKRLANCRLVRSSCRECRGLRARPWTQRRARARATTSWPAEAVNMAVPASSEGQLSSRPEIASRAHFCSVCRTALLPHHSGQLFHYELSISS